MAVLCVLGKIKWTDRMHIVLTAVAANSKCVSTVGSAIFFTRKRDHRVNKS